MFVHLSETDTHIENPLSFSHYRLYLLECYVYVCYATVTDDWSGSERHAGVNGGLHANQLISWIGNNESFWKCNNNIKYCLMLWWLQCMEEVSKKKPTTGNLKRVL